MNLLIGFVLGCICANAVFTNQIRRMMGYYDSPDYDEMTGGGNNCCAGIILWGIGLFLIYLFIKWLIG